MDRQFQEVKSTYNGGAQVPTKAKALELSLPEDLIHRKIYFYIWVNPTNNADYALIGTLRLLDASGSQIGGIPVAAAISAQNGATALGESVVSYCNTGGGPVQDTMSLILVNPVANQPTNGILLQPFYLTARIARIVFSIDKVLNVQDTRYYLEVVSN